MVWVRTGPPGQVRFYGLGEDRTARPRGSGSAGASARRPHDATGTTEQGGGAGREAAARSAALARAPSPPPPGARPRVRWGFSSLSLSLSHLGRGAVQPCGACDDALALSGSRVRQRDERVRRLGAGIADRAVGLAAARAEERGHAGLAGSGRRRRKLAGRANPDALGRGRRSRVQRRQRVGADSPLGRRLRATTARVTDAAGLAGPVRRGRVIPRVAGGHGACRRRLWG